MLKTIKEKLAFIDSLDSMDNQSVQSWLGTIVLLANDRNTEVRMALAKQLVIFDCDEVEDILCRMLEDKNKMVRLEAVDSLAVGRHEKSIEKVATMLVKEGSMIRMYAAATLFDLIINAYGMNEKAFGKYRGIVKSEFENEKNLRVLLIYYRNEYYMQPEKGLYLFKDI